MERFIRALYLTNYTVPRLWSLMQRIMHSGSSSASTVAETKPTNPKLEELLKEKGELEAVSSDPEANIDYIFGKYEGQAVDFYVDIPGDYWEDERAQRIVHTAFEEYARLEHGNQEGIRSYCLSKLEDEFQQNPRRVLNDASNWRMAIERTLNESDWESNKGFTIMFYHNRDAYPARRSSLDNGLNSQLRYRLALNAIETSLIQEDVGYSIKTR